MVKQLSLTNTIRSSTILDNPKCSIKQCNISTVFTIETLFKGCFDSRIILVFLTKYQIFFKNIGQLKNFSRTFLLTICFCFHIAKAKCSSKAQLKI